jgi:hypothetical protein
VVKGDTLCLRRGRGQQVTAEDDGPDGPDGPLLRWAGYRLLREAGSDRGLRAPG